MEEKSKLTKLSTKEIEERLNNIEAILDKLKANLTPKERQMMEAYIAKKSNRRGA